MYALTSIKKERSRITGLSPVYIHSRTRVKHYDYKKVWHQAIQEIAQKNNLSIIQLCRLFGYSKQSFYKRKVPQDTSVQDQILKRSILEIKRQLPRCGVRKVQYLLNGSAKNETQKIGRDYLFSFIRERGLLVSKRKKYHITTNSKHWMRKYPNIIKDLKVTHP
jgi:hypothetical protein